MRDLHAAHLAGAFAFALVFVAIMSRVREPARQRFNAVFVAGAGAAYFSSGLGLWELAFTAVMTVLAYLGLRYYAAIGAAWLCHTGWDVVHHLYADPILVFVPTSSGGCAIADALIAAWFFKLAWQHAHHPARALVPATFIVATRLR